MLKDIFKKSSNNSNIKEKICQSLLDGYVDIKAYRYDDDNNKKLVYHDTGDNTVTNWMRQVIMQMLAGVSFSNEGCDDVLTNPADPESKNITSYNKKNHEDGTNTDGCVVSNTEYQYIHDGSDIRTSYKDLEAERKFPLYPTKVLLGTGKEYVSWDDLQAENEEVNPSWYSEMIENYGSGEGELAAKDYFDQLVSGKIGHNYYSGTFGAQNVHNGGGSMLRAVTVNDPISTVLEETPADLANRYGIVGAVKTLYLPKKDLNETLGDDFKTKVEDIINPIVSESGRLLRPRFRGAGRPCFIYFNKTQNGNKLDYCNQTANVFVSRENKSSAKFLNRITFRIVMPAQKGSGLNNQYYPYNGYTLKQIGLFNDALLEATDGQQSDFAGQMPCGTMLAIKNIAAFTKTAEEEIIFTWTLTI